MKDMNRVQAVRRVLRWARPYWPLAALGMLLSLCDALWNTQFAAIQKDLLDLVNKGDVAPLVSLLWKSLGMIMGLVVLGQVGQFLKAYVSNLVGRDFRRSMFSHVSRLPLVRVDSMHSGDLISRTTGDAGGATGSVMGSLYGIFDSFAFVAFAFVFLSRIHMGLTLVALAAGPLIFLSGRFFDNTLRRRAEQIQRNGAELRKVLQEDLQGIGVVRAFGLEQEMVRRFSSLREESRQLNLSQAITRNVMWQVTGLANVAVMLLCASVIALAAIKGQMSAGSILAFIFLVGRVTGPFAGLSRTWGGLQEGLASAKRVFEIMDIAPEVSGGAEVLPQVAPANALDIRDVSFTYPGQPRLFEGLSLSVAKGELVGIVGPSGSGKSTLAKLCLGLYLPDSGSVRVGGHDLSEELEAARADSSYVPQSIHVFAATVGENVEYGRPGASDEEVSGVIRESGLSEVVADMPEGLQTKVGERGVNLSGGQRQRLALARALLRTPSLVVLDEATSALDNETEALVQKSIENLRRHAGVLVIAHRLTTVTGADRILVLDGGRVVEEGSHPQLIAAGGLYARLWSLSDDDARIAK